MKTSTHLYPPPTQAHASVKFFRPVLLLILSAAALLFSSCGNGLLGSQNDGIVIRVYDSDSYMDCGIKNAGKGRTVFRTPDDGENCTYNITISSGTAEYTKTVEGGKIVEISNLLPGSYFISCTTYKSGIFYKGTANADVSAGETATVTLVLRKMSSGQFYNVSFVCFGNWNTKVGPQTVEYGGTVTKPDDPTESGYVFVGWFTDEDCTKEFDFNTKVYSSLVLYAKWDRDPRLEEDGYIEFKMSEYIGKLNGGSYVEVFRCNEDSYTGTDEDVWERVIRYSWNGGSTPDSTVVLKDYYVEKGKSYYYKFGYSGNNSYINDTLVLKTATNGLGEIKVNKGRVTYNEGEHALVFSESPYFELSMNVGDVRQNNFSIVYKTEQVNNGNRLSEFDLDYLKDGNLYIRMGANIENMLGQTLNPEYIYYYTKREISQGYIYWYRELKFNEGEYPVINVPNTEDEFLHMPTKDLQTHIVAENGDYDFIYEVVNNSEDQYYVSPFVWDPDVYSDYGFRESLIAVNEEDILLEPGASHQFRYKMKDLKQSYGSDRRNISIGCYFQKSGTSSRSSGWSNSINDYNTGRKHTVTITAGSNKENSWEDLPPRN